MKKKTNYKGQNQFTKVADLKHKMVLKNLQKQIGKGEKITMTKAMVDAGYSKSYAESGQVTKKKSWAKLMEEFLPDSKLAEVHQELLNARELSYFVFPKTMTDLDIEQRMLEAGTKLVVVKASDKGKMAFYSRIDTKARKDGLDLGYKIKGKMAPESFKIEQTGLESMTTAEIEALIAKKKAFFNKTD